MACKVAESGGSVPLRRRPADVGLRKISAHRLGRLYGTSEAWPRVEVPEMLESVRLAMPP